MNRLAVFVVFFALAWFVPAWPLLLLIGVIWLVAKFQSSGDKEPPPGEGGEDQPEPPPAAAALSDGHPFKGRRGGSRNRFFGERKGESKASRHARIEPTRFIMLSTRIFLITIKHHGRCEKEQPNMEMLEIELP